MIESPSERLRRRRLELGFASAADAARRHNWDVVTYRSHENDSRGTGISKKAAEKYAKAYKVSLDWLLTGIDQSMIHFDKNPNLAIAVRYFPIVPLRKLEAVLKKEPMPLDAYPMIPAFSSKPLSADAVAVRIADDAMTGAFSGKSFPRGDVCVFDPDAKVWPGDFCQARVAGEELPVFRRYSEEAIGVIRLEPLNPTYPTYWIKEGSPGEVLARLMLRVDEH